MHPLSLLFYGLAAMAAAAIVFVARVFHERTRPAFGLAGLALLTSLPAMAFLGAFSIGGWIALVSIPLAVALPLLAGSYRRPLAALAAVNLAVAGFWTPAAGVLRPALAASLSLAAAYAAWRVLAIARDRQPVDGWLVALPACLAGLTVLLLAGSWSLLVLLPTAAALLAAGLAVWNRRYRPVLLGLLAIDLLLIWGLLAM